MDVQYTLFFSKYFIQRFFICLPSDFTVSEDAGIEPTWTIFALAVRRCNHSAIDLSYCMYAYEYIHLIKYTYICTVDHIVVSLVNLIFNFAHEGGRRGGQLLAEIHHHQMQIGNRDGGIRMGGGGVGEGVRGEGV
jgi:hypothetical protein